MEKKEKLSVQEREKQILEFWEKKRIYEKIKKRNAKGKRFYFLQGPPYTSGRLHIGHAWNNSLKDIVLRYKRMNGFNVWDRAGYDMHGLPTENAVQKKLGIKDKLEIENYGVEKFINECIKFSSENALIMNKDLQRLGVWMDFENAYWPINNEFIEGEWWLIKKAWEQKRLYKGKKIMHWCSHCETSLAKHELEYKTVKDNSIYLKFKLKNKEDEYLIIWTTTPWTIPFNLAVMANPDVNYVKAEVKLGEKKEIWIIAKDLAEEIISEVLKLKFRIIEELKGKDLEGIEYEHPFYFKLKAVYDSLKKKWPKVHSVVLSKEYVDTSSGSGLVHCAPGCGPEDYEVGKSYGMDAFNTIDEKGIFVDMGEFSGLKAKEDDVKFTEALKEVGSLIKEKKVEHEYAHCWRCHNAVVFRATEQWFMKIEDLIPKLLDFNKKVKWQPKFASKNYDLWIENLKDNGITRQRYWGCPIPIWQCSCGEIELFENADELRKRARRVPKDLHKPWIDNIQFKCKKCGQIMKRVPDVIDVWVDSGTTSWNSLYYPKNKKYISWWPADFILEATEQIKLWFSMLQMCSAIAFGKSCYKQVYCHGMILDYQGMKMSKSLGNIISPYEVVDKHGADILRYYMCGVPAGENINFNWEDVKQKKRNLNILENLSRLLLELHRLNKINKNLDIEEEYIISRKNSSIKKVSELMKDYRIDEIIKEIESLYLDLSRVYIQFTREKVSSENAGKVLYALKEVYEDSIKMFSIICPFISESIWQNLRKVKLVNEESVHLSKWPKFSEKKINKKLENDFKDVIKIIEAGLAERDKLKIGLKWPLRYAEIKFSKTLDKELMEIIKRQLNVKEIEILKSEKEKLEIFLDAELTPELEAEGFSRELSRKIQAMRKNAGLQKGQQIELVIKTSKKLIKILKKHLEFIKERTNSETLKLTHEDIGRYEIINDFKVKDQNFKIAFNIKNKRS